MIILRNARERYAALPPEDRYRTGLHNRARKACTTVEGVLRQREIQNFTCAACDHLLPRPGESPKPRSEYLDHCHGCLIFRGVLCNTHNQSIGLLGDCLEGVGAAVEYLKGNIPTEVKNYLEMLNTKRFERIAAGYKREYRFGTNSKPIQWQKDDCRARKRNCIVEEIDELRRLQKFKCAVCPRRLHDHTETRGNNDEHIDHCHATDLLRGLLCGTCNTAIGKFGDTVEGVQKAYNYLLEFYQRVGMHFSSQLYQKYVERLTLQNTQRSVTKGG